MEETVNRLQTCRRDMMLRNLAYFMLLLGTGTAVLLLPNISWQAGLIAVCVVIYLFAVRPFNQRYLTKLREAILQCSMGETLFNPVYHSKEGVAAEQITQDLFPGNLAQKSFFSREHLSGGVNGLPAELADVSFPLRTPGGRNMMFNGCFVSIALSKPLPEPVRITGGEIKECSCTGAARKCLEQMCDTYRGGLYIFAEGRTFSALCWGTFLGARLNPLFPVTEARLCTGPVPQWQECVRLSRLLNGELAA